MTHTHSYTDSEALYRADRCPCCTAPLKGSDHCPQCYCEVGQRSDTQHAREYAVALHKRLVAAQFALEDE